MDLVKEEEVQPAPRELCNIIVLVYNLRAVE